MRHVSAPSAAHAISAAFSDQRANEMIEKLFFAGLMLVAPAVNAATCEEAFEATGDSRNGKLYASSITKPGMSVSSALGQLRKIGADDGLTAGQESISGGSGELYLTWDKATPNIVLAAKANSSGQVTLSTKLAKHQKMTEAEGVSNICGILNKLRAGKEGEAIASAARANSGAGAVIDIKAEKLSAEVNRELNKAAGPLRRKGMFKDLMLGTTTNATERESANAFGPVVAKYMGRKYRINGVIHPIQLNQFSDEIVVAYDTRRGSSFEDMSIRCALAPDQIGLYQTVAGGDSLTLVGTVSKVNRGSLELSGCRQAK